MRKQNRLSDDAFGLLADLIGGHTLQYEMGRGPLGWGLWSVDGKTVDVAVVRELRQAGLIWQDDDSLVSVAFHVTRAGYAYVRNLADA